MSSSSSPYQESQVRRVTATVAAASTDAVLWPAEAGKRLRVLAVYAVATAATALTVNRKPSGSGVAISPAYTSAAGVPTADLAWCPHGWFQTGRGEGLSCTTGAGQPTAISLVLASLPAPEALYLEDVMQPEALLENGDPLLLQDA